VNSELPPLSDEQFRANRFEIVSRLADDLAHEIKNPLNAIVINLELLKVRANRGDVPSALQRADVIEHETRRLHGLLDRLLQLLRPEREELSNLPLDQVLDEIVPLIEAQVRLARNELISECAIPVFVPVRRDIFKFAMLNLITAVHDTLGEEGGTLAIRCSAANDHAAIEITADAVGEPLKLAGSAVDVAGSLLIPSGATVRTVPRGVSVRIPRAAAV
jgi:signal transduction histidine kinase